MNWDQKTIHTYDKSAKALADYFKGIGARVYDIELGLKLANKETGARVVEIGCGDGRDTSEIIKRVSWYEGFDPSEGLLQLARRKLPGEKFVNATAQTYDYPPAVDVVFAFASLLHVNKKDLRVVFDKVYDSLVFGGIFFISLKERPRYVEEVKSDAFGERMFYYYSVDDITRIASSKFKLVYEDHQKIGETDWFTVALKKV